MTGGPEQLLLHALRVKGAATAPALAAALGREDLGDELEALVAATLVTRAGAGEGALLALTPPGQERDRELVAAELSDDGRAHLASFYEASFQPVNAEFKRLCAEWQTDGESFELLERVVGIDERIEAFLAEAATLVPRLGRYSERLGAAFERVQDGDGDALVGPIGDSFHNVWFELHEDLIATLGRTRAEEEA
jgi:hypothetical protein